MLRVEHMSASYGTATTLRDITFSMERGASLSLLGRNGMGKTSTLRVLMGLRSPRQTSGRVILDDEEISLLPPYAVARRGLGYVPQGRRIFPSLSVNENLAIARGKGSYASWREDDVYELFPTLRDRRSLSAGRLSGGEQQMLAIGRALMTSPRLLVLDEPSEGLAPTVVEGLVDAFLALRREGLGLLLAEQDLSLAAQLTEHVVVLENGRVQADMPKDDFLADEGLQERLLGLRQLRS